MSTEDRIQQFIIVELWGDSSTHQLTHDYPLLEKEVVDSLGIFQLVSFVESDFGIEVADEDLVPDNFNTISDIARLVNSKGGS